ncbi:MAG: archaeosortase/exosortase family protein [Candidatus Thiodiazotropha sp. (ex Lucinoma kastoroae)]|nr:archaeosortase/exosortase family protein [Candidatus Thiodiazotropha sp. (ex Lucinoma kastoroae)]
MPVTQFGLSVVFLLMIFAYWDSLGDMLNRWNTKEEYGYGYFIPFITVFLIWQRRSQIFIAEFESSRLGFLVVLFAAVLFILGEIATERGQVACLWKLSKLDV